MSESPAVGTGCIVDVFCDRDGAWRVRLEGRPVVGVRAASPSAALAQLAASPSAALAQLAARLEGIAWLARREETEEVADPGSALYAESRS